MPSRDDRVGEKSGLVPMPGLKSTGLLSGPLPTERGVTPPVPQASSERSQAPSTGQLPPSAPSTGQLTSANLTRVLTAMLPRVSDSTELTSQRVPVVIKASMKKPAPAPPPLPPDTQKKRRLKVTVLGIGMLALIVIMTLFSVTPLGHEIGLDTPFGGSLITGQNPGPGNFIAQATATAVYHRKTDGYDPSFYGSQLIGNGSTSLAWPLGQCTFWANYEYHRLTGYWISWNGNADQWVAGARQAGWHISTTPHVPSIMVMMPYTQYASGYGHVAVVEGVSGNIVHTSNMNWYANGGGWDRVSNVDFTVGGGVYFIWHS